jgi:hypothetical protein
VASVPTAAQERAPHGGDEVLRLQVPQTRSLQNEGTARRGRLPSPVRIKSERHSLGGITFECLGGGLVGHFPSAARSSLRQGRGPQRRARLASRLFTSSFPRGRARRRCSLGGAPPPSFWPGDEEPGEAHSGATRTDRPLLEGADRYHRRPPRERCAVARASAQPTSSATAPAAAIAKTMYPITQLVLADDLAPQTLLGTKPRWLVLPSCLR